jgi:hypothetical protein
MAAHVEARRKDPLVLGFPKRPKPAEPEADEKISVEELRAIDEVA